jgi:hypothetical protein
VETFEAFTPDNDPHKERDFGAFEHNGERIFWKIDYYDTTLTKGSEDFSRRCYVINIRLCGRGKLQALYKRNVPEILRRGLPGARSVAESLSFSLLTWPTTRLFTANPSS